MKNKNNNGLNWLYISCALCFITGGLLSVLVYKSINEPSVEVVSQVIAETGKVNLKDYKQIKAQAFFWQQQYENLEKVYVMNNGEVCHTISPEVNTYGYKATAFSVGDYYDENGKPFRSMSPFILPGVGGNIYEIPYDQVEIGNIVAITQVMGESKKPLPKFLVHRVIGRTEDGLLVTRGDNNPKNTVEIITEDDYLGVIPEEELKCVVAFPR